MPSILYHPWGVRVESDVVLRLEGVRRIYLRGEERVTGLDGVDLALEAGTFTVVLGPSGGGKSTLLHLLGGMDRPDEGRVWFRGQDLSQLRSDELAAYRRTKVGFVFQSFHLLAGRTALENVELPMLLSGVFASQRRRRAQALLERVGLADRLHHLPHQLSGGQAQRVAIARALAMDPEVVLADEPTGNLDSASGAQVVRLLVSLAHDDGRTVVMVTHNTDLASLADRVVHLRDGRVVKDERVSRPRAVSMAGRARPSTPKGTVGVATLATQAWGALRRHLARSVLTGLGVTIGIAAMVLLVGTGAGLEQGVVSSLTSLGPLTSITVSPQATIHSGGLMSVGVGPLTPLTPQSLATFASLPGVRGAYASPTLLGTMAMGERLAPALVTPMPPARLLAVPGVLPTLLAGRWPQGPHEIVVSQSTSQLLAANRRPAAALVGKTVRVTFSAIRGGLLSGDVASTSAGNLPAQLLRISGVAQGSGLAYAPYATVLGWLRASQGGTLRTYPSATVLATDVSHVANVARRIQAMGYGTQTMSGVVRHVQSSFRVIEIGLGAIGGVALVVAGLMIAVVMSMAVMERRREIGVLRAVGARRRDVAALFLTEAAIMGLAGAVVGILLGSAVGLIGNQLLAQLGSGTLRNGIFTLPAWLLGFGLAFGTGVAVFAGALPASRAASLDPVVALRDE
jgi:ABC-type lipoprotein export system ATPase subunit/ABC-type antimicrobial peptide transport system permease subunit